MPPETARPAPPDAAALLRPFVVVVAVVGVMWAIEIIDWLPSVDLDRWGIRPRQVGGLTGIVASPFLHADFTHLLGNTIPFLVLGCIIAASGVQRFVQVSVIVAIIAGIGTWLIGPSHTIHIGASGMVFGYLGYLVARGAFERKVGSMLVSLAVLLLYGSLLWGLLPRPGISWQGHLFGLVGGVVAAWVIHRPAPPAAVAIER